MPRVEVEALIRAPVKTVYALAQDVERFPEVMPDLEAVRVLQRDGNRTVTEWVGRIQGRRVRWVEEDVWDDATYTCTFRQQEGDFDRYEGVWSFEPADGWCRTRLVVDFALTIPLLGPLLGNLIVLLVRKNVEKMLDALRLRAEQAHALPQEAEDQTRR